MGGCDDMVIIDVTDDDNNENEENNANGGNAGGIIAGILVPFTLCVGVLGFVYYRKRNGQTICPQKSESCEGSTDTNTEGTPNDGNNFMNTLQAHYETKETAKVQSYASNPSKPAMTTSTTKKNMKCAQCSQQKAMSEGKADENDGCWYCNECWA